MIGEDTFMKKIDVSFCKDSIMKGMLFNRDSNILVRVKCREVFTDIKKEGAYCLGCRKTR